MKAEFIFQYFCVNNQIEWWRREIRLRVFVNICAVLEPTRPIDSAWNFIKTPKIWCPVPCSFLFPCVKIIWLSNSCNSDFSSANLLLLFFTIVATSDRARRSRATSRSFSAPSLICKLLKKWNWLETNQRKIPIKPSKTPKMLPKLHFYLQIDKKVNFI